MSGGRFELAIGAGDWPDSYTAWGEPYPPPEERIGRLVESIAALRQLWTGEPVTVNGDFVRLVDACCAPAPTTRPRIVVGVGKSFRTARATLDVADELNVYADEAVVAEMQDLAAGADHEVGVSLFLSWEWDKWPAHPVAELERWRQLGIDRVHVSLGGDDMPARLGQLAPLVG